MSKVQDDERVLISFAGRDADTVTPAARSNVGRVNTHVDDTVGHIKQLCGLCFGLAKVVDVSIRGISFL